MILVATTISAYANSSSTTGQSVSLPFWQLLLISFLTGGVGAAIASGIINFITNKLKERENRRANFLLRQIQELYGPINAYISFAKEALYLFRNISQDTSDDKQQMQQFYLKTYTESVKKINEIIVDKFYLAYDEEAGKRSSKLYNDSLLFNLCSPAAIQNSDIKNSNYGWLDEDNISFIKKSLEKKRDELSKLQ
jgi:hypothetical protein